MRSMNIFCLSVALLLFLLPGLNGCEGLYGDFRENNPVPSASRDGQISRAKRDVEMYDKILTEQLKQRRELQKKIENASIMDHVSRAVSSIEAVRTFDSSKIITTDQEKLEHLDRRIRETRRNLDNSKKKLQDLEKQQEGGGDGGGSSC